MRKYIKLGKHNNIVTKSMFKNSNVKSILVKKGAEIFEDKCFSNLNVLEKVEFSPKVVITRIGESMFEKSENLVCVVLPNNLIILPDNTFKDCSKLSDITLPQSLLAIGKSSFESCINLKQITLPNKIIEIRENAFQSCQKLYTFDFPLNLETIGNYAFSKCKNLMDIRLNDKLVSIGEYAFSRTSICTLSIPNSVKKIGKGAFCDTPLYSITLPNGLEKIEGYCFYHTKLTNIEFPQSLTYIGNSAFNGCVGLKSIKITKNITKIGASCFLGCMNLKEIIIENDDVVIGEKAFYDCINLERIVYKGVEINVKNLIINNLDKESLEYLYKNCNQISSLKAKVPLSSLKVMKKLKLDQDFYKEAYYKNYRTLYEKLFADNQNILSQQSFFLLCYTLGVFKKEISHKSSQIILKLIEEGYINKSNIIKYCELLKFKNIDLDMINTITDKQLGFFYNLVKYSKHNPEFMGLCLESYQKVQKINISNTNGYLKPTIEKFVDYHNEDKFGELKSKVSKKLAKELGIFYSSKETFLKGKTVLEEFYKDGIIQSLISEKIRKEKKKIKDSNNEFNHFIYEFLNKDDPKNFTIAKYFLGCCSHLEGKGEGICIAAVLNKYTQTLVMYDKEDNPVSKAVFSVNEKERSIVINAIYIDYAYCNNKEEKLVKKYVDTFKLFIEDYNKHNNCNLNRVYLGKSASALVSYFGEIGKDGFCESINYGKYGINNYYNGDWHKGQLCIYDSKIR